MLKVYYTDGLKNFQAWGVARQILHALNDEECEMVEQVLERRYPIGIHHIQLNDILVSDVELIEDTIGRTLYGV